MLARVAIAKTFYLRPIDELVRANPLSVSTAIAPAPTSRSEP